jgi:hypothetical protein
VVPARKPPRVGILTICAGRRLRSAPAALTDQASEKQAKEQIAKRRKLLVGRHVVWPHLVGHPGSALTFARMWHLAHSGSAIQLSVA